MHFSTIAASVLFLANTAFALPAAQTDAALPNLVARGVVSAVPEDSVLAIDYPTKRYVVDKGGYRMMARNLTHPVEPLGCSFSYCIQFSKRDTSSSVTLDQLSHGISLELPDRTVLIDEHGVHSVKNNKNNKREVDPPIEPLGCSFNYCISFSKRDVPASTKVSVEPLGCSFNYCISFSKRDVPASTEVSVEPLGCSFNYCISFSKRAEYAAMKRAEEGHMQKSDCEFGNCAKLLA